MCVPREALLSALALRVAREAYAVRDDELRSLRALGCTPDTMRAAFAAVPDSEAKRHALERIDAITAARA